ncbi:immunodominant staphylococcal antigen IsaB family protein [Staphylococcus arlettae]|uniref:immunodominant staphylococcal antigen IsaB family protein n=1 Tax=Staphylococcus arlettae TaxID=29378 RepID=UPI002DB6B278|nr:hypothetical protein [Staphylococcus arlettae]MEB6066339.1 hypothetical protein [Staphylococcus arlettae]
MKKVMQLFSSTVVVSTLIVGTSAAYITTSNANAQAAEQVQKWGYGEGGASSESGTNLKAETLWYNYEGYTTYDPSFTQDYNFVRALKYDNVSINGYKVDPNASNEFDHSKTVYDTTVNFNENDEVVMLRFDTKPDTISKKVFKQAHESNAILAEGDTPGDVGTFIRYETNDSYYNVYFDKQGYLYQIEIH